MTAKRKRKPVAGQPFSRIRLINSSTRPVQVATTTQSAAMPPHSEGPTPIPPAPPPAEALPSHAQAAGLEDVFSIHLNVFVPFDGRFLDCDTPTPSDVDQDFTESKVTINETPQGYLAVIEHTLRSGDVIVEMKPF